MERGCFLSGETTVTLSMCITRAHRWDHRTTPAPVVAAGERTVKRTGILYDAVISYFSLEDEALARSIFAALETSGVRCWPNPRWLAAVVDRRAIVERARAASLFGHSIEVTDGSGLVAACARVGYPCVIKVGNRHAGLGKHLAHTSDEAAAVADGLGRDYATVEPFVRGESYRVFVAGAAGAEHTVCVRYDNAESWIKNGPGCEVVRAEGAASASEHAIRAHRLFQRLPGAAPDAPLEGTQLSGVDFVAEPSGAWHFLEWNGFPWLGNEPEIERLGRAVLDRAMGQLEGVTPVTPVTPEDATTRAGA